MFDAITHSLIDNDLFGHSGLGPILLYFVLSLATGLGLPRQIAALSAAALFGITTGFIIATFATISGCLFTVLSCRYLFADWVFKKFPDKSASVHNFLSENTFVKALIIRILPLGSNFLTNIIAGATRIPIKPYIAGSAIGFVPQMVLFSLAGGGVKLAAEQEQHTVFLLTSIAILLTVGLWIKKRPSTR